MKLAEVTKKTLTKDQESMQCQVNLKYASLNIPWSTEKALYFPFRHSGGPGSHKQTTSKISGQVMRILLTAWGDNMPCYKHHDRTSQDYDTILQMRLVRFIQNCASWRGIKGTKPARLHFLTWVAPSSTVTGSQNRLYSSGTPCPTGSILPKKKDKRQ